MTACGVDDGMADWLTDRRLRAILASFFAVRVVLITLFILAYANMDPEQPWDALMERFTLSTVVIGGDAMIDLVCTVVAFILALRTLVASLSLFARILGHFVLGNTSTCQM
ncbi:hypothetical protein GGF31_008120 [Allomyces arbusculus]|nr:hypothetical protein GGF31_008120 [Allomyces arbusculus]